MPNDYSIHPIPLVKHNFAKPKMTHLHNYGQIIDIVNYIWFLEGPKQNIIVDAGIPPERLIKRGYDVESIQTVEEGLKELGLGVEDIDMVIVTHSDHDHIALAHKFRKARFLIQKAELNFARNPHPLFKALRPKDQTELMDGLSFEVVEGDIKVDDNIELLLTPGHTPGGQSVAVKTKKGRAIITGWCCIQENFDPPPEVRDKGLSFIPPGMHTDLLEAYESVAMVKRLADLVIPIHELGFIDKRTIP